MKWTMDVENVREYIQLGFQYYFIVEHIIFIMLLSFNRETAVYFLHYNKLSDFGHNYNFINLITFLLLIRHFFMRLCYYVAITYNTHVRVFYQFIFQYFIMLLKRNRGFLSTICF